MIFSFPSLPICLNRLSENVRLYSVWICPGNAFSVGLLRVRPLIPDAADTLRVVVHCSSGTTERMYSAILVLFMMYPL